MATRINAPQRRTVDGEGEVIFVTGLIVYLIFGSIAVKIENDFSVSGVAGAVYVVAGFAAICGLFAMVVSILILLWRLLP